MSSPAPLSTEVGLAASTTRYQYTPLTGPQDIRILELEPAKELESPLRARLSIKCLTYVPDYEALSYTWQPTFKDEVLLEQNLYISDLLGDSESSLEISGNLAYALRRIRHHDIVRSLWVDAVCIDMTSVSERNHQVSMMASIYLSADSVLIWLGEDSEQRDGVFVQEFAQAIAAESLAMGQTRGQSGLQSYAESDDSTATTEDFELTMRGSLSLGAKWGGYFAQTALARIFVQRRYFYRRWTIQEIFYGASIVVICGSASMTFTALVDSIRRFSQLFENTTERTSRLFETRYGSALRTIESCHRRLASIILRRESTHSGFHHAVQSLYAFQELQCHDPRVKVFALASLWNNGFFRIDYSLSCEDVYLNFARSLVSACQSMDSSSSSASELTRLVDAALSQGRSCPSSSRSQLPSWVPDWRLPVPYISPARRGRLVNGEMRKHLVSAVMATHQYQVWMVDPDHLKLIVGFLARVTSATSVRIRLRMKSGRCELNFEGPNSTSLRDFCVAGVPLAAGDVIVAPFDDERYRLLDGERYRRADLYSIWLRPSQSWTSRREAFCLLQHGPKLRGLDEFASFPGFSRLANAAASRRSADMRSWPVDGRVLIV